jgi:hypothetical protein
MNFKDYMRSSVLFRKFPALAQQLNNLEKEIKILKEKVK